MTVDEFNAFCASLPHTTHVVQWGDANVWKVGGKMFAVGGWHDGKLLYVTFKVSAISFDLLKDKPGLRPAPYLASRGFTWIQRTAKTSMSDKGLRDYLTESHRLIAQGLSKKIRAELGFDTAVAGHRLSASKIEKRGTP